VSFAQTHQGLEEFAYAVLVEFEFACALLDTLENGFLSLGVAYLHTAFLLDVCDALGDVRAPRDGFEYLGVYLLYFLAELF